MTDTIAHYDWKDLFRKRARRARAAAHAAATPSVPKEAAARFRMTFEPDRPAAIAVYHPVGDELDTLPLAEALMARGHAILLPVVTAPDAPLSFRLWEMDDILERGAYGVPVPPASAKVMTPTVVVCPLLAARPDGARLGMGGGFYDRTLTMLRKEGDILAIGFGYDAQWQERFPVEPHDAALDGFASEARAVRFERRGAS